MGLLGAWFVPAVLTKPNHSWSWKKKYRINTRWSQADVSRYPVKDCHEMVQDQLRKNYFANQ